jgi:hypothetical protein
MTVINLNKHTVKNKENLSHTWMTFEKQSWNGQGTTVNGDAEYLNIWNENFKDFSGNILEIGAGTGFLANHILETNKNIFKQDWDLLIAIHCLSETPQYYYTDIYENLSIKKFFVIDYGIEKDDPAYEPTLQKWFNGFDNGEKIINLNLAGAAKRNGIPVYIGK